MDEENKDNSNETMNLKRTFCCVTSSLNLLQHLSLSRGQHFKQLSAVTASRVLLDGVCALLKRLDWLHVAIDRHERVVLKTTQK
jgi:hypothetical protein